MDNLLKRLGKIPVNNYFLSKVFQKTEYQEKIKYNLSRDYILDYWLDCFDTKDKKGNLVFCKDVDWHTDSDFDYELDFRYSVAWGLKTKNSKLEVKNQKNKIKSLSLEKGDVIKFKNCNEHRLLTNENNISLFLTIDFKKEVKNLKQVKVELEKFVSEIDNGTLKICQ